MGIMGCAVVFGKTKIGYCELISPWGLLEELSSAVLLFCYRVVLHYAVYQHNCVGVGRAPFSALLCGTSVCSLLILTGSAG